MSNFIERQGTLNTGLWLQLISRTRFARCAFSNGSIFMRCPLFSHPKLVARENSAARMLTILGFWLAAQTTLTFTAHISLQVWRELAGLDAHDRSLASGSADVLGCEVSPAKSYCSGTGERSARIGSVARTISSLRSPPSSTCG